jgi:hypothetical protein
VILVLCVVAAVLTFRGEWILKNILKIPEPSEKAIVSLKFAALFIAVILFIAVFRV